MRLVFLSIWPKLNTPVGQVETHAEQRTHSGSCMAWPLLAKLITSMPWWHTLVQLLQLMHLSLSAKILKRLKRAYICIKADSGQANRHQTRPENLK